MTKGNGSKTREGEGEGDGGRWEAPFGGKITRLARLTNRLHIEGIISFLYLYTLRTNASRVRKPQRRAFSLEFHRSPPLFFIPLPFSLIFPSLVPWPVERWAEQSHRKSPEWYFGSLVAPSCTGCCVLWGRKRVRALLRGQVSFSRDAGSPFLSSSPPSHAHPLSSRVASTSVVFRASGFEKLASQITHVRGVIIDRMNLSFSLASPLLFSPIYNSAIYNSLFHSSIYDDRHRRNSRIPSIKYC